MDSMAEVSSFGKASIVVVHVADERSECDVCEPVADVRRFTENELSRRRAETERGPSGNRRHHSWRCGWGRM